MKSRRLPLRLVFFLGGLAVTSLAIMTRESARSGYAVPEVRAAPADAKPFIERNELKAGTPAAHAATIVRLADRSVLAFWFAGSREGAGDVRIFGARLESGRWSVPEPTLTVAKVMADEMRFVRKLGNPVAHVDGQGQLHLFFVSVSLGGWATSNLNQMSSADGGRSWNRARVLPTSPFANMSTLARAAAVPRTDGGFDLPVYHEGARKFPELLRFSAQRSNHDFRKVRMGSGQNLLQPSVVALNERAAVALLRNAGPDKRLKAIHTGDGGETWSDPIPTDQINPDSSISVSRLSDGMLVMAYNPRSDGRSELSLSVSHDGLRWTKRRIVEIEPGGEFSYPSLLADDDNDLHLVYTWQRKHIRHLHFNRAWLMAGGEGHAQ